MLVMAGKPVDATIDALLEFLEPGDCIIDGGNEWCGPQRTAMQGSSASTCWRGLERSRFNAPMRQQSLAAPHAGTVSRFKKCRW